MDRPLPFVQLGEDFNPCILNNRIHLDIVPIVSKGIFQLTSDALDAIEREGHQADDQNGPPAHLVDHGEGQDTAEEGEDLLLVDQMCDWHRSDADGLHLAISGYNRAYLNGQLGGLWCGEPASVSTPGDEGLDHKGQLQGQAQTLLLVTFEARR